MRADLGGLETRDSQSEEIVKLMEMAIDNFKKGNTIEAVKFLNEAIYMIKSNEEFQIKEIALCDKVDGYGIYEKKPGNAIKAGEPILFYIEPIGFKIEKENGQFVIWISEDAKITNEEGEVIFQKTDWINYNQSFSQPNIPFYITNRVADIPAGKYTFMFTLKDHYKKTFLSEKYEFVVE